MRLTRRAALKTFSSAAFAAWLARLETLYSEMSVGEWITTPGAVVDGMTFSDVQIGCLVAAPNVTLNRCRFKRMISDGANGSAIVVEGHHTRILEPTIDGSENVSHGAGIFFAPGSEDGLVRGGLIRSHPRVGIAMGSTTYWDFGRPLPWSYHHVVEFIEIAHCGWATGGGDAGSGIAIVGNTHRVTVRSSRIHHNRGKGISESAALQGPQSAGHPMLTEVPTGNVFERNDCYYNGEEGICRIGSNYPTTRGNRCDENSQAGWKRFRNYRMEPLGPGADLRGATFEQNESSGEMPAA